VPLLRCSLRWRLRALANDRFHHLSSLVIVAPVSKFCRC
jgi:hypothetical protein